MIVAIFIIALLASMSTVLVTEMSIRARHVEVDLEDIKAFEAAEAGIDAALFDINASPTYAPYMDTQLITSPPTYPAEPAPNARRTSNGIMIDGALASGNTTGYKLVGPQTKKPIKIHITRKADGGKPGCLGTTNWIPPPRDSSGNRSSNGSDIDGNDRPTWRSLPLKDSSGNELSYTSGPLAGRKRYCEDGIVPQSLGSVAFFTYAVDWFHDGTDNDGDGVIDDRNERNKYTIYSTGIHRGITQSGVTEAGKVVTVEVVVQALDKDRFVFTPSALRIPIGPIQNPPGSP